MKGGTLPSHLSDQEVTGPLSTRSIPGRQTDAWIDRSGDGGGHRASMFFRASYFPQKV